MQASASLVTHVEARVAALDNRNSQLPADLAGLTDACLQYVQGLSVMHHELASFVEVQMLKQQDQIDQVGDDIVKHACACCGKLEGFHSQATSCFPVQWTWL